MAFGLLRDYLDVALGDRLGSLVLGLPEMGQRRRPFPIGAETCVHMCQIREFGHSRLPKALVEARKSEDCPVACEWLARVLKDIARLIDRKTQSRPLPSLPINLPALRVGKRVRCLDAVIRSDEARVKARRLGTQSAVIYRTQEATSENKKVMNEQDDEATMANYLFSCSRAAHDARQLSCTVNASDVGRRHIVTGGAYFCKKDVAVVLAPKVAIVVRT